MIYVSNAQVAAIRDLDYGHGTLIRGTLPDGSLEVHVFDGFGYDVRFVRRDGSLVTGVIL